MSNSAAFPYRTLSNPQNFSRFSLSACFVGVPQGFTCIENKGDIPHIERDTRIYTPEIGLDRPDALGCTTWHDYEGWRTGSTMPSGVSLTISSSIP
jgi:hypothetical protein